MKPSSSSATSQAFTPSTVDLWRLSLTISPFDFSMLSRRLSYLLVDRLQRWSLTRLSPELVVHHLALECEQPRIWLLADPEVLVGHDWSPLSPHGLQRHGLPFAMTITLSDFLVVEVCLRSLRPGVPLSLLVAITTIFQQMNSSVEMSPCVLGPIEVLGCSRWAARPDLLLRQLLQQSALIGE